MCICLLQQSVQYSIPRAIRNSLYTKCAGDLRPQKEQYRLTPATLSPTKPEEEEAEDIRRSSPPDSMAPLQQSQPSQGTLSSDNLTDRDTISETFRSSTNRLASDLPPKAVCESSGSEDEGFPRQRHRDAFRSRRSRDRSCSSPRRRLNSTL